MQAFLVSTLVVALAEMGDKTQLLAILLATRFRRPAPIILGILAATLANHALAATAGFVISGLVQSQWFRIGVAVSFLAMAGWTLFPDSEDELKTHDGRGAFLTTLIAFFLVEIGDKTQVATVALAARFHDIAFVAAGTTLGMMLANVPAVYLGEALTKRISMTVMRRATAALFFALGAWALWEALRPSS